MTLYFSPSVPAFYDTGFAVYKLPSDAIEITAEQCTALQAAIMQGCSITVVDGQPVVGAAPTPAPDTRITAKAELDASDVTIIRCYEHGVAVPAEWTAYRAALRTIVGGTSTTAAVPARPASPVRT